MRDIDKAKLCSIVGKGIDLKKLDVTLCNLDLDMIIRVMEFAITTDPLYVNTLLHEIKKYKTDMEKFTLKMCIDSNLNFFEKLVEKEDKV